MLSRTILRRRLSPIIAAPLLVAAAAVAIPTVAATPAYAMKSVCMDAQEAAHRGSTSSTVTENTIAAAERAASYRANYTETDLRLSKSGTWWLMHDRSVDRTTNGRGYVKDLYDKYLAGVRTNDGRKMPTAQSFLWHLQTDNGGAFKNVTPILDMKDGWTDASLRTLISHIRQYGFARHVIIQSSSLPLLFRIKRWAPEMGTALVATNETSRPGVASVPGYVDQVTVFHRMADATYVRALRTKGKKVAGWGANSTTIWNSILAREETDQPVIMTDLMPQFRQWCGG